MVNYNGLAKTFVPGSNIELICPRNGQKMTFSTSVIGPDLLKKKSPVPTQYDDGFVLSLTPLSTLKTGEDPYQLSVANGHILAPLAHRFGALEVHRTFDLERIFQYRDQHLPNITGVIRQCETELKNPNLTEKEKRYITMVLEGARKILDPNEPGRSNEEIEIKKLAKIFSQYRAVGSSPKSQFNAWEIVRSFEPHYDYGLNLGFLDPESLRSFGTRVTPTPIIDFYIKQIITNLISGDALKTSVKSQLKSFLAFEDSNTIFQNCRSAINPLRREYQKLMKEKYLGHKVSETRMNELFEEMTEWELFFRTITQEVEEFSFEHSPISEATNSLPDRNFASAFYFWSASENVNSGPMPLYHYATVPEADWGKTINCIGRFIMSGAIFFGDQLVPWLNNTP